MVFGVADYRVASAGEVFFRFAGDGRIQRGEDEIAIERRFETFDDQVARIFRNGRIEVPAGGFGVTFAGRAFGGRDFGELEPRVIGEDFYDALTDQSGGAQHACAPF